MGYNSDFTITVEPALPFAQLDALLESLESKTGYYFEAYGRPFEIHLDGAKWYDWTLHMEAVSKDHPDYEFSIEIDGEDRDDHTKVTYKDGRIIRRYKLVWVPADE